MHGYIAELVAQVLVFQKKLQLPINPFTLRHKEQVIIQSLDDYFLRTPAHKQDLKDSAMLLEDGVTLVTTWSNKPLYLVLYNDQVKSETRKRFTIAHELAHIYLRHKEDSPEQEKEADVFAAELLAPRCMLWELHERFGFVPPELVQKTFHISISMAKRRLDHGHPKPKRETMEYKLWKRSRPLLPTSWDW